MYKPPKIFVMGSFVVDLMAFAPHLPVPGETVKGGPFEIGAGGKGANQAVAARRCGAEVSMITKIGHDSFGQLGLDNFRAEGINTDHVLYDQENGTGVALILLDRSSAQNMILVAPQACENISREEIRHAEQFIAGADIVVTQLETNLEAVLEFAQIARAHKVPLILNPAPYQSVPDELYTLIDWLTPNETEAAQLTEMALDTLDDARRVADELICKGAQNVIITLGGKGCWLRTAQMAVHLPPRQVDVVDTTGAGDAFNGGFAYALASGMAPESAAQFASDVAALSVTRVGTAKAMPYREEIESFRKLS